MVTNHPFHIYYHDLFTFPLPEGHRFPMGKYRHLRERVQHSGLVNSEFLLVPPPASDKQLALAHDQTYIDKVASGALSDQEIRRIGFPWSPELVERSRRSVGSTIAACRSALKNGMAANLAGGTHHAFADHGEGFCVFNDAAVAALVVQNEGLARSILILDCDVHQGNGTASILQNHSTIFTFSIHGQNNFPFRKESGDLDIGLPDGAGDAVYLEALEQGLNRAFDQMSPELVIYLAGADPFINDRLGRLALSKSGLAQRDQMVIDRCLAAHLPLAIVMAGGYAPDVEDIVDIHFQTLKIALARFNRLESISS